MRKIILLLSVLISLPFDNFAQMLPEESNSEQVQLGLGITVLAFGLILTISVLYFLLKMGKGFGNVIFKTIGIILILTASLFLVVTGYSQAQIAPVIGLLGTIAGFVFGSNLSTANSKIEE
jgi:hypothetical protein